MMPAIFFINGLAKVKFKQFILNREIFSPVSHATMNAKSYGVNTSLVVRD